VWPARANISPDSTSKITRAKWKGVWLFCKHEATKKKKKKRKKEKLIDLCRSNRILKTWARKDRGIFVNLLIYRFFNLIILIQEYVKFCIYTFIKIVLKIFLNISFYLFCVSALYFSKICIFVINTYLKFYKVCLL
jgi:hypothetical protein